MKEVLLTRGYIVLVDDEDYERVMQYSWFPMVGKHTVYAATSVRIPGRRSKRCTSWTMQRMLLGIGPLEKGKIVDHIDSNGLNNQRTNLRLATRQQNTMNTVKMRSLAGEGLSSQYKGVCRNANKRTKWTARITHNGQPIFLGSYADEEEAARAYDAAAREHFGEFAKLNFAR
jgi:hypothetical protein